MKVIIEREKYDNLSILNCGRSPSAALREVRRKSGVAFIQKVTGPTRARRYPQLAELSYVASLRSTESAGVGKWELFEYLINQLSL